MLFTIKGDGILGYRSHRISQVLNKKVLKRFWERKVVDIGLSIPATLSQVILEVMKFMEIGINIPATLPQVIVEFMDLGKVWPAARPLIIAKDILVVFDLGHKRPGALTLVIG